MSLASMLKEWVEEKNTQLGMWLNLDKKVYIRYHSFYIHTAYGTAQIEHLLLSRYGIFVIDTRNYTGWIYGAEKDKNWTQNLSGKKSLFQNPLYENYKHTRLLSEFLKIKENKIHSIVFFIGDAVLRGEFPSNVITGNLSSYIKGFADEIFSEYEFARLHHELEKLKSNQVMSTF